MKWTSSALPDLLATRNGRRAAFACLYMTEGIPLGFAATAVATQLGRQGASPAEVGTFVTTFYLPWAFKWAFGPLIDTFASERFGRRRGWILGCQLMMALTLLSLGLLDLPAQLGLFTALLFVHNCFGAMQDVAIDALACATLAEDERGTANGLMFAGSYVGQALGGAGVLYLSSYIGFQPGFAIVAAAILAVTVLIVLPMKEAPGAGPQAPRTQRAASRVRAALAQMAGFVQQAARAFLGTRAAMTGLCFALLPAGALCLGLSLQSTLALELGLDDAQLARMQLGSTLLTAAGCVCGGWLSDRWGRRRLLALFLVLVSLPVALLAALLAQQGWILPLPAGQRLAPAPLIQAFWIAIMVYSAFQGLMYGSWSAVFMDLTQPRVAATQFTAYMALQNLAVACSASWQGHAVEAWGYPLTMGLDAAAGLAGIALLPLLTSCRAADGAASLDDGQARPRLRSRSCRARRRAAYARRGPAQ